MSPAPSASLMLRAPPASQWLGVSCGVAAATLFAGKAILVRLGFQYGAGPTDLLTLRMLASLPFFVVIAWWMGRDRTPLSWHDRMHLMVLGVLGYHIASWLDFAGLDYIDAALERVVLFVYPTVVTVWAIWTGKRTLNWTLMVALVATYLGIVLTWGDRVQLGASGTGTTIGVLLVVSAALAFALYMIRSEDIIRRVGGVRAMAISMLGASVTSIVHGFVAAPTAVLHPTTPAIWIGIALGITATVIPALLAGVAIQHLGAPRAAVVGCIAPVITALLGWAFLAEVLGLWAWIGCFLTMWGALMAGKR